MKLIIDVNGLAGVDYLKLAKTKDTLYKRCSRYIGHLVKNISVQLQAEGYEKQSVSSSLEYTNFRFSNGKITRILTERLSYKPPVKASVEVEVSTENLAQMQAFLKSIKIPGKVISVD